MNKLHVSREFVVPTPTEEGEVLFCPTQLRKHPLSVEAGLLTDADRCNTAACIGPITVKKALEGVPFVDHIPLIPGSICGKNIQMNMPELSQADELQTTQQ